MSPTISNETKRRLNLHLTRFPAHRNRRRRHHHFAIITVLSAAAMLGSIIAFARFAL